MSAATSLAAWNAASMFDPLNCTSIGAGSPWLSTASTMPPDWKYALRYGSSRRIAVRTRAMYS